jgi:G2/mitotic-specific cyclin 2
MPNPEYMKHQVHLQWRMRGILVDWLIEVHAKFRLLPETLFLGVNLVDRFLTARTVTVERLQLIGITALLIASKYEEVMAPSIEAFIYIADGGYTEEEILKAERYLLKVVNFDLSYPNPMNFLRRISKADDYDIHTRTIAKYLIEISLVDDRFLRYTPSLVAAAGMFLSRQMMERGSWVDFPSSSFSTINLTAT